jgi:hypothetical protein
MKNNFSLLIHTCDHYEKFWPGMFYTLDFYWDYDSFPVYFANEEKHISEMVYDHKGNDTKPNPKIKQILTGKTDKNGFSDRFIKAISEVESKWVMYMQEDMWLRRNIDTRVLNELIQYAEEKNADSIKIHHKIYYYDSYILEPTDDFIDGLRILKHCQGENMLLSHNATIWRKDYILENQKCGEDPWTNEEAGSKRMSTKPHNHYLYNIHWYAQPGISDRGEFSQEGFVYGHIVNEMKNMEINYNMRK